LGKGEKERKEKEREKGTANRPNKQHLFRARVDARAAAQTKQTKIGVRWWLVLKLNLKLQL
jgi:hypothetical protein